MLVMGERVVVPRTKQQSALAQLHATHQGIFKTRVTAQAAYIWPGISNKVKIMVEDCEVCPRLVPSQAAEPEKSIVDKVAARARKC